MHLPVVGRRDVPPGEIVAHRPERRVAVDPEPVFERELGQRRARVPDAPSGGLRFDLRGPIVFEPVDVRPITKSTACPARSCSRLMSRPSPRMA